MSSDFYGTQVDRRRKPPGERQTYEVKQLWQRTHEILNLAVLGLDHRVIAEMVGVHFQTVSNAVNSTLGRKKLALMRDAADADSVDVLKEIKKLAPKALKIYEDIMDDEDATQSMKLKAAEGVLSKQPEFNRNLHFHAHLLDDSLITQLKERGKAIASANGKMLIEENIIDVTPTDSDEDSVG